jgi:hypothetical protein
MTRKDFILISTAIRATQERIKNSAGAWMTSDLRDEQLRGVRRAAAHICDALVAECGKAFDPGRFLTDCGYGATSMNPRDPALDLRPLPGEGSGKSWDDYEPTERAPRATPRFEA